ncbi:MAG: hypothetical protein ACYCXP_05645 [Leptospirillum sp.]
MINYIPLTFFGLIAVVGLAFFVHGFMNRQKIFADFQELAKKFDGRAGRDNIISYPWFEGHVDGRDLRVFFHTSENHTVSVLNLVSELGIASDAHFVLLQKDGFRKPKPEDLVKLQAEVGPALDIPVPFDVRSPNAEETRRVLSMTPVTNALGEMTPFNQILVWDGRILFSKQFDGVQETNPAAFQKTLSNMVGLCHAIESGI